MNNLFRILAIVFVLIITSCRIASVDYAVGEVKLLDKLKTTVDGKPAISFTIKNDGRTAVSDVFVTVKAKRQQVDVSVQTVGVVQLEVDESTQQTVIFENLSGHQDYDLITYAVNFTTPL